jgi:multisubunit Na+/H+ antiporter MnhB subunit
MLRVLLVLGCLALAGVLVWALLGLPADVGLKSDLQANLRGQPQPADVGLKSDLQANLRGQLQPADVGLKSDLQPDLSGERGNLPALVEAHLEQSGVSHPVTAVLLNFRGYDTLLEIGVLLLAVLGVLAVRHAAAPEPVHPRRAGAVLEALIHLAVPLMVLVAGYLLWAGAHQPGGAFQAGAMLAGAGVLLRLSGRLPALLPPGFWLRAGLLFGFSVFVAVALGTVAGGGELLTYPPDQAGAWILLIESSLTLSIGLILVSLFVGAPAPPEHGEGAGE